MLPKSIFPGKTQLRLYHAILLCVIMAGIIIIFTGMTPDIIPMLFGASVAILTLGAYDEIQYRKSQKDTLPQNGDLK